MSSSTGLEDDVLSQLIVDLLPATVALLIPGLLLYASLYAFWRRWIWTSRLLSIMTLAGLWMSERVAPVRCAALRALFNFMVAAAAMKLLDIHARHMTSTFPTYTAGPPPPASLMALILLTELRYESFTPHPIRHPLPVTLPFIDAATTRRFFYDERLQLAVHIAIFLVLQNLPQYVPVKAVGILFTIWILWTSMQLCVRYKTSPALFGPIYLANSLESFWTETWHNAFASPCYSLAYKPTISLLKILRMPRALSRGLAVISGFGLMAIFHVYSLKPMLDDEGIRRIGLFFTLNGVFTVLEVAVWGKTRHWLRALCAWIIEISLASWTVAAIKIADGVLSADWKGLCRPVGR